MTNHSFSDLLKRLTGLEVAILKVIVYYLKKFSKQAQQGKMMKQIDCGRDQARLLKSFSLTII